MSDEVQKADRYEINGEGLYVIIRQQTHDLEYRGINWSKPKEDRLPYHNDEKRICETFKLWLQNEKPKPNVLVGRDLTNAEGKVNKKFDDFIEQEVLTYPHKPSFVMFFLMSHGLVNGEFLLSTDENTEVKRCCTGNKNKEHSFAGKCHARLVGKDIIKPISDQFKEIPKIFVIQTCRGSDTKKEEVGQGDKRLTDKSDGKELLTQLFVADSAEDSPDVLLLRACVEGSMSYVSDGSFMNKIFCELWQNLARIMNKYNEFAASMDKPNIEPECLAPECLAPECLTPECLAKLLSTEDAAEVLTGGWLADVCQRLMIEVSKVPMEDNKTIDDRQQPHVSSTLTKRLSCLDIMRTQDMLQ